MTQYGTIKNIKSKPIDKAVEFNVKGFKEFSENSGFVGRARRGNIKRVYGNGCKSLSPFDHYWPIDVQLDDKKFTMLLEHRGNKGLTGPTNGELFFYFPDKMLDKQIVAALEHITYMINTKDVSLWKWRDVLHNTPTFQLPGDEFSIDKISGK